MDVPKNLDNYRVSSLVDPSFDSEHIQNIDFKRHLRPEICLIKKTEWGLSGRPSQNKYYDGATLIAIIKFEFLTTNNNFVYERKVKLYYISNNGTEEYVRLLNHSQYDLTEPHDGAKAMKERVNSRKNIIEQMKSTLSGFLQASMGTTMEQVISTVYFFWNACEKERNNYIELGSDDFYNFVGNIDVDITTGPYTWMAIEVEPGVNIKQYIMNILSE